VLTPDRYSALRLFTYSTTDTNESDALAFLPDYETADDTIWQQETLLERRLLMEHSFALAKGCEDFKLVGVAELGQ
jgi:hypothetical protein